MLLNSTARSLVAALLSIATAKSAVGKLFHSVMDSFDGHILAFFLAVYHFLQMRITNVHKFFLGDVKAKKDDIENKTDEALEEDEDVNVNEETDAGKEFVDTENIKGEDDYENQNIKKNEGCELNAVDIRIRV